METTERERLDGDRLHDLVSDAVIEAVENHPWLYEALDENMGLTGFASDVGSRMVNILGPWLEAAARLEGEEVVKGWTESEVLRKYRTGGRTTFIIVDKPAPWYADSYEPVRLVRRREGGERDERSEEYRRGWRDAMNQKHVPEEPTDE